MNGFKEIYNDTWVMEDGGVRIFLAAGKEKALVIDTGMTGLDIHKAAKEVTDLPLGLINTHCDPDHTGGNAQFSELKMWNHIRNGDYCGSECSGSERPES